jgi:hypothetical protein
VREEGVTMREKHSVEEALGRVRRELQEALEQIPDRRIRAKLIASVVTLYVDKLLESLPNLERTDPEEARGLRSEARELQRKTAEVLLGIEEGERSTSVSLEPGLN